MRSFIAGVGLGAVLLAGCNHFGPRRTDVGPAAGPDMRVPTAENLVGYLNDNARRVSAGQALKCTNVAIDCSANGQSVGLGGMMVCQKPHNFRLQGKVMGQPAVDIGSNNDEFWYWISKSEPPYLFHCSYEALGRGARIPFPFQPDMVVAALGLAEYDLSRQKFELKVYDTYLELIEQAVSPEGQPIQKVTAFNRRRASAGQPQVIAYALKDSRGGVICQAKINRVQVNQHTGAVLPQEVVFNWPAQKINMKMQINNPEVVALDPQATDRLFTRRNLSYPTYDLASRSLDSPGLQRAGGFVPRSAQP